MDTVVQAYMQLSGLSHKSELRKKNLLILVLGAEGFRICQSRPGPKETMKQLITGLATFYTPLTSLSKERVMLFDRLQDRDDIEGFATKLRMNAPSCGFEYLEDGVLRDFFIHGLNDRRIRDRLLEEPARSFEQTVERTKTVFITERVAEQRSRGPAPERDRVTTTLMREDPADHMSRGPASGVTRGPAGLMRGGSPPPPFSRFHPRPVGIERTPLPRP